MRWVSPFLLALCISQSAWAYYGLHATEADLTYEAKVEIPYRRTQKEIRALIDQQIQHLMGTFQSESFKKEFGYKGALGESYSLEILGQKLFAERGRIEVTYRFRGPVVFEKEAFYARSRKVLIKLPHAPDRIYNLGIVGTKNRCTDDHYNGEEDFWYFWDPEMKGCPLAGNDQDILRVQGEMTLRPSTRIKYPEYDRLFGDNGNGEIVDIWIFYGFIGDIKHFDRPKRRDLAIQNMREFEAYLLSKTQRFVRNQDESLENFTTDAYGNLSQGVNRYHVFEKPGYRVHILLSDTDSKSPDPTFHSYYRKALKEADLLVYDGHAGSGENLNIEEKTSPLYGATLDPNKYQIFFFNGCSTYPYFKGMYFRAKDGTKNLEIVTAGLPTLVETSVKNMKAFLEPFLNKRTIGYQRIMQNLEKSNGKKFGAYLFGVSGEEDNEFGMPPA